MGFILERQSWFNILKLINVTHHVNRLNQKNHMFQSIDNIKSI